MTTMMMMTMTPIKMMVMVLLGVRDGDLTKLMMMIIMMVVVVMMIRLEVIGSLYTAVPSHSMLEL